MIVDLLVLDNQVNFEYTAVVYCVEYDISSIVLNHTDNEDFYLLH